MNIERLLQDLHDKSEDLKDMKKECKGFEKDTEQEKELKKMRKEISAQIKELKDNKEQELFKDQYYKDLRDDIVKLNGDVKEIKSNIYNLLSELSSKGESLNIELSGKTGSFRAQSKNDPTLFINGKKI